jgi:hypothetical protein
MLGRLFLAGMLVGVALGAAIGWVAAHQIARSPGVQVLHGFTSAVNHDGTALGLVMSREAEAGKSFNIAGTSWRTASSPVGISGPVASRHVASVNRARPQPRIVRKRRWRILSNPPSRAPGAV